MKKILTAIVLLISVAGVTYGQKKHLTDEQLTGKIPEGIVKPVPSDYGYIDGGLLKYRQGGETFVFDIRKGISSPYVATAETPGAENGQNELVPGWQNPTLSPDKSKIAYTLEGNLYSIDLKTKRITQHTFDGSNLILNGYASWVYYEEIFGRKSRYKAFWWSPDSQVIAFYRFDNTKVPEFPIYLADGHHGELNLTRYPKAGDTNPEVRIGFVSAYGGETVWADFNPRNNQYFGTPFWSGDGKKLMISWMDRAQDNLVLYSVNPYDGQKAAIYDEHQDSFIDWMEQMLFTDKGIYIVRDMTGWQQIYFLGYDGAGFTQLTTGHNWSISLLRADRNYVYYTAKCDATTRTDIYRARTNGKGTERLSSGKYNYAGVIMSPDGKNIAALESDCQTPPRLINISLPGFLEAFGKKVRTSVVADSRGPEFDDYALALPEIVTVTTRDGLELPARVIWPVDMDRSRSYPVKVDIYGGPDNPQVFDRWAGVDFRTQWWANHGVIQVVLDNRDGGHLGKEGINMAYRRLGTVEFEDFIDGIKYFRQFPYVNKDKVGVEGFSFGGTMTTLCVTEGNEYFQYGIAGGGVYDWSLYDSHYTERYMDRPQDNPEGYAAGRVIDRLENYKGDDSNMLRLTHGTGDDNVHFQNTLQLVSKLEEMRRDFELMIYPGGMHGYRGNQASHSNYQDYKFWYRYLLESKMPDSLKNYLQGK